PDAAHLDLAGNGAGGTGEEAAVLGANLRIIVADQHRAAVDEAQRKVRLAAARLAPQQHAAPSDGDAGAADGSAHGLGSGKRSTKRAPVRPSRRSSTAMLPSWPVMVARAMARPRPEWRRNPSSSG